MTETTHISSLLITAQPAQREAVCAAILETDFSEIAHVDASGKIIVTLETSDEQAIVSAMTDFQTIKGVVNTSLVYHQADPSAALDTIALGGRHD